MACGGASTPIPSAGDRGTWAAVADRVVETQVPKCEGPGAPGLVEVQTGSDAVCCLCEGLLSWQSRLCRGFVGCGVGRRDS